MSTHHVRRPLAARLRRHGAHLPALLVAEGLRPRLFPDGLPTCDGWVLVVRGLGSAVHITTPLPVHHGTTHGAIVEVELRGEDWWGRFVAHEVRL